MYSFVLSMAFTLFTLLAGAVLLRLLLMLSASREERKFEELFAMRNHCAPPRLWIARWPRGADFLVKAFWHARARTLLDFLTRNWERCATTHEQRILFESAIGTIDPENVEAVLCTQFADFGLGLRPAQAGDLFGDSILTQEGPKWEHSKKLLRNAFSAYDIENFEAIKSSVRVMLEKIPLKTETDLQNVFFNLTLETILTLLFGIIPWIIESDASISRVQFATAFSDAQEYVTSRARLGPLYWLINTPRYRRTCHTVHAFVDDMIHKTLTLRNQITAETLQSTILDSLLEHTTNRKALRDQCVNILLAGRDTTACCLSWTIWLLVRHPQCLAHLRSEIQSVVGIGKSSIDPTRRHLDQMSYLNHVITEVLRLYPPVPLNFRAATKLTTLPVGGGPDGKAPILIRKGQTVAWSSYGMHRRKDIYGEDAHEFRPERWETRGVRDVKYAYVPFHGGPRACPGQRFALLEVKYTVVRLLQRFSIALPEGEKVVPLGKERQLATLVLSPADGCRVVCTAVED